MDYSLPGSSVHGDSPGKNTGVTCHALFHGVFPTKTSNQVSHIASRFFTIWATREAQNLIVAHSNLVAEPLQTQTLQQ